MFYALAYYPQNNIAQIIFAKIRVSCAHKNHIFWYQEFYDRVTISRQNKKHRRKRIRRYFCGRYFSDYGAGDENRTHNKSLGSSRFTTKLRPRLTRWYNNIQLAPKSQLFWNYNTTHSNLRLKFVWRDANGVRCASANLKVRMFCKFARIYCDLWRQIVDFFELHSYNIKINKL